MDITLGEMMRPTVGLSTWPNLMSTHKIITNASTWLEYFQILKVMIRNDLTFLHCRQTPWSWTRLWHLDNKRQLDGWPPLEYLQSQQKIWTWGCCAAGVCQRSSHILPCKMEVWYDCLSEDLSLLSPRWLKKYIFLPNSMPHLVLISKYCPRGLLLMSDTSTRFSSNS